MSIPQPKNLVTVIRQKWILITPQGSTYDYGSSYHLSEPDRLAMIQEVAERLSTDMEAEREEPIGDPEALQTTPEYYEKIKATTHGLRVK